MNHCPRLVFVLTLLAGILMPYGSSAQNLTGDLWSRPVAPLGVSGILDVTPKGSEYWAVGIDGVFKSTNLTTWSKVTTTGLTDTLFCLRWTGSRFVASGFGCWTSTDGVVWTRRAAFTPQVALGMAVRGTTVVAAGVLGAIHHSADGGITWTRVDLGQDLTFTCVAATPTHFIAAGGGGVIYNSTDGLTWVRRNSTTVKAFADITLAGSRLVAVGEDLTVATSTDNGSTWASYEVGGGAGFDFRAVAGDASTTIMLAPKSVLRTATPAVPSSITYLPIPEIQADMNCALRGSNGWVCCGKGNTIMTSPDTNAWTLRHPASGCDFLTGVRTSSNFVLAGVPGDKIMRSTDGVVWAQVTSGIPNTEGVTGMAWSGSRHIACTATGKIYSTTATNGTGFLPRTSGTTQRLSSCCWTGSQFFVCGNSGTILSSSDGTTWAARNSGSSGNLYGAASSGSVHVVCGGVISGFSRTAIILTSTNGIAWTQTALIPNSGLFGIEWNGNQFAAVGLDGLILTSPDGQVWTEQFASPDANGRVFDEDMSSLVWAGTNWIAATNSGGVVLSIDGVSWKPQQFAGGGALSTLIYGASKAVAAGDAGQILTSSALAPRPPAFVVPPFSQSIAEGSIGVLSALASGTPDLTYQWRRDGEAQAGAVSATFAIPNASAADSASYDVVVTGPGGSVTSVPAVVRVQARPAITVHPVNRQAAEGSSADLSVIAVGAGPFTYQWYNASTGALTGSTSSTLMFTSVTPASAGEYYVEVANEYGTSTSTIAVLTVTPSLTNALDLPAGTPVSTGGSYTWTGTADDTAELRSGLSNSGTGWMEIVVTNVPGVIFDWMASGTSAGDRLEVLVDGASVFGFEGPQAWKTRAVPAGAGSHTVRWQFIEDGSPDFSGLPFVRVDHVVLMTASSPPVIAVDPEALTAFENAEARFSVRAAGSGTLNYQWRKDGVPIPGATYAEYVIPSVAFVHSGLYSVAVSNAAGTVISVEARLSVIPSLASALELPSGLSVTSGGGTAWEGTLDATHDGVDAARSGVIPAGGVTWLEIRVTGMTAVSFWWKVSSEGCCDHLRFYHGAAIVDRISGVGDGWRQVTTALDPFASTVLRWEYSKDGSVVHGEDRAWLDQVQFTPLTAVTDFPLWAAAMPAGRRIPADRNGPLLIENTMAYALGINPLTATAAQLPALQRSGSQWIYSYTRTKRTTEASYRVEWSADPAAAVWNSTGVLHEQTAAGQESTSWRAVFTPPPGAARVFLRLRVSLGGAG